MTENKEKKKSKQTKGMINYMLKIFQPLGINLILKQFFLNLVILIIFVLSIDKIDQNLV